jgi:hypothetical protein
LFCKPEIANPEEEVAMAKVQGVKEKVHLPIYDAFLVKEKEKFGRAMNDQRSIRFFVDVQNKTRLETNLQASGVLSSLNEFEARALRVVFSSLHRFDPKDKLKPEFNEAELLADFINNSVTTLIVGEKVMMEMPTWFFPGGAGVQSASPTVSTHGDPNPRATFHFAEPVFIDKQQSFRVEILFPQGVPGQGDPDPHRLANAEGPIRIWVVLDGYLTRDVQ